jgi:protein KRI1
LSPLVTLRFEEPDQDFIKSYPRTLKDTVRKEDTRRRDKREEVKARKEREKSEKRAELERLKELKREEIMERLKKIKEVSGNDKLVLEDEDLVGDFDPEEHDRRMAAMYGGDYYEEDGVDAEGKPVFEYDEEIDGEN